jgi:hypothetical protein
MVVGPGDESALNVARRDQRLTVLPGHFWATEDGNELRRRAIAEPKTPLERWPPYQA